MNKDPAFVAAQLRRPSGDVAVEVAERLNKANTTTNHQAIALLDVQPGEQVLEIGPANGAFAPVIVESAPGVTYAGLDWSPEMVQAATARNQLLVQAGHAQFVQGSSDAIPFEDAAFDKVLTVHTLYFWEKPEDHLAEIRRVLKPGGLFCLCFGDRAFMENLPFAQHGFRLFDRAAAETLLRDNGFTPIGFHRHTEREVSNTGETMDKQINMVQCTPAD